MKESRRSRFRKHRFFLDAGLALVLLLAVLAALSSRARREESRFRRAEKADLAGPSTLLGRMDVPEDWPDVGYDRLLIGDDGEEILFYLSREDGDGLLLRREKTDGLLLTPAPSWNPIRRTQWTKGEAVLPLFLFPDDTAAVRAEVRIRLSGEMVVELTQTRGETDGGDGSGGEPFFLFRIPIPELRLRKAELLQELQETNAYSSLGQGEFPADIRLYDGEDRLLETRAYTIRSRSAD